jgi:hypothetical protein
VNNSTVLICVVHAVYGRRIIARTCEDDSLNGMACYSDVISGLFVNICECGASLCNNGTAGLSIFTGGSFTLSAIVTTAWTAVAFVQWFPAGFM